MTNPLQETPEKKIRAALLRWYRANRRDLPWRRTQDPYAIWISEIMLQQTRVAAVIEYYERFMREFPSIEALADAKEERVLAAWSGLGYYRRARNLQAAAKEIVVEGRGEVPRTREELRELPGIGRYTSAAIASIAYGEPVAVVDGNVERVLERLDGIARTGESVWERAQELLVKKAPGDWNQAMMELGATVCTPVAPLCDVCPLRSWCKLPGHDVRKAQAERKKKELSFGLAVRGGRVYLQQRSKGDSLMAGMWDLPSVEISDSHTVEAKLRHSITNTDYVISVFRMDVKSLAKGGKWFRIKELASVPLTGIARKALRETGVLLRSRESS